MKDRISREALNIRIAGLISLRGTCERLQVGAVITNHNRIVGTGYNGTAPDIPHCNPFMCRTDEPCQRSIHAEANAIKALHQNIDNPKSVKNNLILYCTHQPCLECAKKILSVAIHTVYYIRDYRDNSGIELLKTNNITVIRINEDGNKLS